MAGEQVNFFLDQVDDPLIADAIPAFDGGQFSNVRANLLQPNQSKLLGNCDIDKLGKLRTRRGTIRLGTGPPSGVADTIIQGLTSFQTKDYNYVVAANNRKLWQWNEGSSTWTQIAKGGVADQADIIICRTGLINNPVTPGPPIIPAGYPMGTTVLTVDGIIGIIGTGEKLYFMPNLRTNYFEYTIAGHAETAGNTTTITLEEPGLVFDVKDNWKFTVARPARVNNAAGYGAGATTIAITGYTGEVNDGEKFVIKSENITHTISSHTGTAPTTGLTFAPGLQADWAAADATVLVVFAQGNDSLYFCDGVGSIYGWNGAVNPTGGGGLMKIGSHSILDDLAGSFASSRTKPPTAVKILLWFQNRLIASGIATEPDAIYFSDFFDPTAWDQDYQKVRIGGGESDPITGLLAWTDLNMIVFKKNSIYLINLDPSQNPNPDDPTLLVASFAVRQLHKRIGCPAPLTAVQVGGGSTTPGSDVLFMDGDKRVHSVRRVVAAETQQEVGFAVSLPIQDVLDTINIDHIDKAVAMYHNEHYILGIPSARGLDGGTYANAVVAYNMLTQSWCGVWGGWFPTCFAMRTDLGSYSRLIFGESNLYPGHCNVAQWLDDQSLDDETEASYQDWGQPIPTSILTRAITFGDMYSFKTGLSVEFEFDESVAAGVTVQVVLDKIPHSSLIAFPFQSISESRLRLPFHLPSTLPGSPDLLRLAFDLQRYGTWRELQFFITTDSGKLAIRSIRVTGFSDTLRLQTLPNTGIPGLPGLPSTPGP